ncbi:MAG: hypothetical protein QM765_00855 [Myxococcales bacterium]
MSPRRPRPLCRPMAVATERSKVAISSVMREAAKSDSPAPPYSCGMVRPNRPISEACW